MDPESGLTPRGWIKFAVVSVLWGTPYFLIKVALDGGFSPTFLAWVRVALAAVVLLTLAWRAGALRGLRGRARWFVAFAAAEIAIPFPLIAIGERHVESSLAAILIAAAPLFVAVLALRFDASERAGGRRLVGLVVGLAGVAALVGVDVAGRPDELWGAAAVLAAAFCYAVGPMLLKRHLSDLDSRASMGASLAVALVMLSPAAAFDLPTAMPTPAAMLAVAALGLVCTALALTMFSSLIREVGAGRALVVTYICPVVAVAVGVAVLDERPGPGAAIGLLLILVGSWLSTNRISPAPPTPDAAPPSSRSPRSSEPRG
ncbi:MAG TPA: DMT family transporter [Kofleriaceae bacterium]|nr:DMT family transporter [Kofleriaceae bacterium]